MKCGAIFEYLSEFHLQLLSKAASNSQGLLLFFYMYL